jgi:hypothetical protein
MRFFRIAVELNEPHVLDYALGYTSVYTEE